MTLTDHALAVPDTPYAFEALRSCDLTVQVSTKLNRSHLVHGRQALILPCIARTERDHQRSGPQRITVEDAMSVVHLSSGTKAPISPHLLSEPAIIAGMAQATLPSSPVPWQSYVDDYDRIRDTMAQVLEGFEDFNRRARARHGFRIAQPARERVFETPLAAADARHDPLARQWNTTIYSNDDRYRGLRNLRTVVFMNAEDMRDRGIEDLDLVDIASIAKDGSRRTVYGYRAVSYDIPCGNTAGYMPELNVLCPIGDYSAQSAQPLMKHLSVTITRSG